MHIRDLRETQRDSEGCRGSPVPAWGGSWRSLCFESLSQKSRPSGECLCQLPHLQDLDGSEQSAAADPEH